MKCSRCNNKRVEGQRYCKACRAAYDIERYHKRRNLYIKEFGGKCIRCGSTERLEFDHIKPDTKIFAIGKLWTKPAVIIKKELSKCQLLCKTCHIDKTREDRNGLLA